MRIGILGGGQLGRMLALAGYPLGLRFRFFDVMPDAPAGDLAELVIGAYDDHHALDRFVSGVDIVTYEFENVPLAAAHWLAQRVPVWPPTAALEASQDRQSERELFARLGLPTPRSVAVESADDVRKALLAIGLPALLKTRRMGYDGKGQALIRDVDEIGRAIGPLAGMPLLLDQFVPFERELSIIAVRDARGATAHYPLIHNVHEGGILRHSIVPAPDVNAMATLGGDPVAAPAGLESIARDAASRIMESLNYVGVMAVEFFQHEGRLLLNEMAPRVHNTGHWTMEGAVCSQFENHLRAICGLPLGGTQLTGVSAMHNLIGSTPPSAAVLATPGAHLHLYGKSAMPGRKLGHVTIVAPSTEARDKSVRQLVDAGAIDG